VASGLAAAVYYQREWGRQALRGRLLGRLLFDAAAFVAIPALAARVWLRFTDDIKRANPLARSLTLDAIREWNFGTIAQRLSTDLWADVVFGRAVKDSIASLAPLLLVLVFIRTGRRWSLLALVSFGLYLLPFAVFTNLQIVHDYYAYEAALFLLLAIGWALLSLYELPGRPGYFSVVILVWFALSCGLRYVHWFLPMQEKRGQFNTEWTQAIERTVAPADVLLIYGNSWSSKLPYMMHRRAVMDDSDRDLTDPAIQASLENLKKDGLRLGGVLVCHDSLKKRPWLHRNLRALGLDAPSPAFQDDSCALYARSRAGDSPATIRNATAGGG
jgi:hypothetical protein